MMIAAAAAADDDDDDDDDGDAGGGADVEDEDNGGRGGDRASAFAHGNGCTLRLPQVAELLLGLRAPILYWEQGHEWIFGDPVRFQVTIDSPLPMLLLLGLLGSIISCSTSRHSDSELLLLLLLLLIPPPPPLPRVMQQTQHNYLKQDQLFHIVMQLPVALAGVSTAVQEIMQQEFRRSSVLIPNSIDCERFRPGTPDENPALANDDLAASSAASSPRGNGNGSSIRRALEPSSVEQPPPVTPLPRVLLVGNPSLPLKGFDTALAALESVNSVLPIRVTWVCQVAPKASTFPALSSSKLKINYVVSPAQVVQQSAGPPCSLLSLSLCLSVCLCLCLCLSLSRSLSRSLSLYIYISIYLSIYISPSLFAFSYSDGPVNDKP